MAWWLIKFVEEALVGPLRLLERLDRHIVILEDHFVKYLIEYLLLQTENGLAASDTHGFWYHEGTLFAEHDLFKVHTCEVLLLPHIVGCDEVEERVTAHWVHLR